MRAASAELLDLGADGLQLTPGCAPTPAFGLVDAIVAIWDADGSGVLDASEFSRWLVAYGISSADAAEAFSHLDADQDGLLSRVEIVAAFHDFYISEDADAPGNWLLGPLD